MRIGGARLRHIGAPGDDIGRIVPIGRFRDVGLLAPGLRARRRQVATPVVKRQQCAADQTEIAGARGVGDHRHRRDRREADDAIRSPGLDRIGGDDLADLVPARPHKAATAAHRFVRARGVGVAEDRRPGLDRSEGLARLAPRLDQTAAHQRIFDPAGAVEVPAVGGTARAAARLVVGIPGRERG